MANLFKRIKDVVVEELQEALDSKELKSFLSKCEIEVAKVEALIRRQDTLNTKFHQEKDEAAAMAAKRYRQAEIALQANEPELALRAQEEADYYADLAARLEEKCQKAEKELIQLKSQLGDMKRKLKELQIKWMELVSRENIANITQAFKETLNKYASTQSPTPASKPDEDIDQQIKDLEENMTAAPLDDIDQQIVSLEKKNETDTVLDDIDQRIAKIQEQLNK
jgi:phage shock protein A